MGLKMTIPDQNSSTFLSIYRRLTLGHIQFFGSILKLDLKFNFVMTMLPSALDLGDLLLMVDPGVVT
jgi:hypothetical protein